jgi:heme-degrading monooxygenase HmoA
MHARSGAFQLSPDKVDDAIQAFKDEQLPKYQRQSGYKGFTLLANRETGRVIGISFWETDSDLHSADELGRQAREDIQQRGGGEGDIERVDWEVVLDDMQ